MMRAMIAGVVLALAPAIVPAQEPPAAAPPAVSQETADTTPAVAEPEGPLGVGAATGLPPRPVPPRTMRHHWPIFLLFAVTWIGIVGYVMITGRRVARLAGGLRELEEDR